MNLARLTDSPAWLAAGWTMIHFAWVGLAVALLAAITRRHLRHARPEIRSGAALGYLAILSLSPLFIFATVYEPGAPAVVPPPRPAGATLSLAVSFESRTPDPSPEPPPRVPPSAPETNPTTSPLARLIPRLPWAWLIGSALYLTWLAAGLVGVERLRRSARRHGLGEIPERCRALADLLNLGHSCGVALCDGLAAPVLLGIVRPLILLPPAALGWSAEGLDMVLLHELAHLRRRDNLVNLAQRFVEALLFFHPAVWWLSAWVRLERELCCDRLVVAHTGRPATYASLLMALATPRQPRRRLALAMADRQVLTRVRLILNLEDRTMRPSLPEGFGLLASLITASLLALNSQASPPPAATPEEPVRAALRKAVDDVASMPQQPGPQSSPASTLVRIARAQIKVGDKESAFATIARASAILDKIEPKVENLEPIAGWVEVADVWRDAGDKLAARAALKKMVKALDAVQVVLDEKSMLVEEVKAMKLDMEPTPPLIKLEFLLYAADSLRKLGQEADLEEARGVLRRSLVMIKDQKDPLKSLLQREIGVILFKSGDLEGGREAINQALRTAGELSDSELTREALSNTAHALCEIGEVEKAIELVNSMQDQKTRLKAWRNMVESFAENDPDDHGPYFDPTGIKITIGAEWLRPNDKTVARRNLPRIAAAVRAKTDRLTQARLLAMIAHLQAKAGDFDGARQTAESIPALKRADFAGPSDGFYDAIQPSILAIIAGEQFKAGDGEGAKTSFLRAATLCRNISTSQEQVIAQILMGQQLIAFGNRPSAVATLKGAASLALDDSEPRRSRSLAMIACGLVGAGDLPEASRVAEAIRDYPGLEKSRALEAIAGAHEKAGDHVAAKAARVEALRCVESKAPEKPQMGPAGRRVDSYARFTFIDPDNELEPGLFEHHRKTKAVILHAQVGDMEGALRMTRALPGSKNPRYSTPQQQALSSLIIHLASKGDIAAALDLASTIESPDVRLGSIEGIAYWIEHDKKNR